MIVMVVVGAQTERERRREKRREKKRKKSEGGRQRRTEAKRGKERENAKRKREREVADVKNVVGSPMKNLLTEEDLMWLRLWNVRQDLTKATDEWKHTRSILGDMKKCKSEYSDVLLKEDHAAEKASKLEALKESQDIAPYIRVIV